MHWLVPKDGGGLETTVNLLYTCKECREEKKRAYLENQEEYLKEVQTIKKRNADYSQEEQGRQTRISVQKRDCILLS